MSISRMAGIAAPIACAALLVAGCQSSQSSAQALATERSQIVGSQPPADAGAKYLAARGNDPAAIQAKVDAQAAAFQNRKDKK